MLLQLIKSLASYRSALVDEEYFSNFGDQEELIEFCQQKVLVYKMRVLITVLV